MNQTINLIEELAGESARVKTLFFKNNSQKSQMRGCALRRFGRAAKCSFLKWRQRADAQHIAANCWTIRARPTALPRFHW
jgi:hypothetical protein